jgi:hypothetical protein
MSLVINEEGPVMRSYKQWALTLFHLLLLLVAASVPVGGTAVR